MSLDDLENHMVRLSNEDLIETLMRSGLLKKEMKCDSCHHMMIYQDCKQYNDLKCFRCVNMRCLKGRKRINIRKNSFFEGINISLLLIIKVLIRWAKDIPQGITVSMLEIDHRTYKKIITKFLNLVEDGFENNKLGGIGKVVQIDETALNHGIKAHRGRAANNKTDALCIIEFETNIKRAFACVIADKKASTILPIICSNVVSNSIIHTDEHKSYSSLNDIGFIHDTVCHKYTFINHDTGTNTQAVESFNNSIKLDIKKRKGVKTELRQEFLKEFCWKFNNRVARFQMIISIIKSKF